MELLANGTSTAEQRNPLAQDLLRRLVLVPFRRDVPVRAECVYDAPIYCRDTGSHPRSEHGERGRVLEMAWSDTLL
jgi:hypothetical protein